MKFTTEEIKLCKAIAEKYRKEIEVGDWLYFKKKLFLVIQIINPPEKVSVYLTDWGRSISADDDFIVLWQISDCLKFIGEKGWIIYEMANICEARLKIAYIKPGEKSKEFKFEANFLSEACLKTVLAIVEE